MAEDQHSQLAALLGFEEDKPPAKKTENEKPIALPVWESQPVEPSPQPVITQGKAQGSSYYRIIDRQIDADKIAKSRDKPKFPDWFIEAPHSFFEETETRIPAMHRIKPVYPPLVPWSRLWPMLLRVLGADVPGSKPDLNKLVERVCQGRQIRQIPKCTRYTWSESIKLLIDINDGNFPYRQDFLRLQQQLVAWRGNDGLAVHFIYDEPGGIISHYETGREVIEPWCNPEPGTPLLILSDLGLHTKSWRSLYQWLVFGQRLNLNGIRATVLMPVAEREIDQRLLLYFECIVWDGNSTLKPVQAQDQTEQNPHLHNERTEKLLALLFPALKVELGLLRAIRQLLPANECDISHEAAVWHHAAVNPGGDEWGWQAGSRATYQDSFLKQFQQLPPIKQKHVLEQLGIYHAQLPDELYFEAMHQFIRLDLDVPEQVKEATLKFMSMLVKTYHQHPEKPSLDLWVKRYLTRHDDAALRSEHSLAFMEIERKRKHQLDGRPIEWPADIDPRDLPLNFDSPSKVHFVFLRQKGMELELLSQRQPNVLKDDWSCHSVILKNMVQLTNDITLRYPATNGRQQHFTINLETDLPYRFSLQSGTHQLEIAEENFTIEVQSADDHPDWIFAQGMGSDGLFIETQSRDGTIYRWYWHPPEIGGHFSNGSLNSSNPLRPGQWFTCPGFWYYLPPDDDSGLKPVWADTAFRDQYGLCADVTIAGIMQRFRWIPPGSFKMGSPKEESGRYNDETPHQVNLSQGYWLADTTCTQALWQAVMPNNPSEFKGENRPVDNVSWNDAQQFIETLNQQQPGLNLRLPSEAEWEYACRAGTTGAFNFEGELSLDKVYYRGTWEYKSDQWGEGALQQTAEVKRYHANAWGLYEMHGNLWEWCQDWYGSYPAQLMTDPAGPDTGDDRVLRGGSWFSGGRRCRSAHRDNSSPGGADRGPGFRLARGHQSGQSSSGAGQQPAGTHAAASRGARTGDGLRNAGAKPKGIKTGAKMTKSLIDHFKDLFKK